jgi:hypothetical protein
MRHLEVGELAAFHNPKSLYPVYSPACIEVGDERYTRFCDLRSKYGALDSVTIHMRVSTYVRRLCNTYHMHYDPIIREALRERGNDDSICYDTKFSGSAASEGLVETNNNLKTRCNTLERIIGQLQREVKDLTQNQNQIHAVAPIVKFEPKVIVNSREISTVSSGVQTICVSMNSVSCETISPENVEVNVGTEPTFVSTVSTATDSPATIDSGNDASVVECSEICVGTDQIEGVNVATQSIIKTYADATVQDEEYFFPPSWTPMPIGYETNASEEIILEETGVQESAPPTEIIFEETGFQTDSPEEVILEESEFQTESEAIITYDSIVQTEESGFQTEPEPEPMVAVAQTEESGFQTEPEPEKINVDTEESGFQTEPEPEPEKTSVDTEESGFQTEPEKTSVDTDLERVETPFGSDYEVDIIERSDVAVQTVEPSTALVVVKRDASTQCNVHIRYPIIGI